MVSFRKHHLINPQIFTKYVFNSNSSSQFIPTKQMNFNSKSSHQFIQTELKQERGKLQQDPATIKFVPICICLFLQPNAYYDNHESNNFEW